MIVSMLKSGLRLSEEQFIPAINEMFDKGFWHTLQYEENKEMVKGCTNDYLGPIKAFMPEEIREIFENNGMKIERLTSIGSLTNNCGKEFIDSLIKKPKLYLSILTCAIDSIKKYVQTQQGVAKEQVLWL